MQLYFTDHTSSVAVTPAADLDATNRAHQPQGDRNDWHIQSRERALLPGAMSARSPHWAPVAPNLYQRPWPCCIRGPLEHERTSSTRPQTPCPWQAAANSAIGWWHWCPPRDASLVGLSSLVQTQGLDAGWMALPKGATRWASWVRGCPLGAQMRLLMIRPCWPCWPTGWTNQLVTTPLRAFMAHPPMEKFWNQEYAETFDNSWLCPSSQ